MIVQIKKFTEDEYNAELAKYYEKPNPPEIEVKLKALQKRIVVDQDYSCFKEFRDNVYVYTKSLLLKKIAENNKRNRRKMQEQNPKGVDAAKNEFIDEAVVADLAGRATDSFVRRYFRLENPIVGASFAGILDFKCREVLNPYHKNKKLEAPLSLNDVFSDGDSEGKNTLEFILSYEKWLKESGEADSSNKLIFDKCIKTLDRECEYLDKIEDEENLSTKFLEYLIYLIILQKSKDSNKISKLSNCALNCADIENEHVISIMESAYLDLVD